MMKKLLLITLGFGLAASASAQSLKTYSKFVLANNYENPSFAPTGLKPTKKVQGVKTNSLAVTFTTLGTSANAFTNLLSDVNPISVNTTLNTVLFVHRNAPSVTGSGASGNLRYDLSTDGGITFTTDIGPLNPINLNPCRHPQGLIYNPAGNTVANNAYLVYTGSTLTGGTAFGTTVTGVRKLDGTGNTENSGFNADNASQGTSLVEVKPGEFWVADFNGLTNQAQAYKGIFNNLTNDVDWSVAVTFPDTMANSASASIGFDPTGNIGWYGSVADLNDPNRVTGKFNPIFYKTMDGGLNWSGPIVLDLDSFSNIIDSLGFTPTTTISTAFEADIVVDINGNPHFSIVAASKSPTTDYSIQTGRFAQGVYDITFNSIANKWEAIEIVRLASFRGNPTSDPYSLDTRPQTSRSKDGSKVFFAFTDTEVANQIDTGGNTFPNFNILGMDISTRLFTPILNVTAGGDFDGVAYLTSIYQEAIQTANSYQIPAVMATLGLAGTDPVVHSYANGIEVLNNTYTDNLLRAFYGGTVGLSNISNNVFTVSNNFPNPFSGVSQVNVNLERSLNVSMTITNVLGQTISEKSQNMSAGVNTLQIDATNLTSGIYFYTINAGGFNVTNKMIVR